MSEYVDLSRLLQTIKIVAMLIGMVIVLVLGIWMSKWGTTKDAPLWKQIITIIWLIAFLIIVIYNYLGAIS